MLHRTLAKILPVIAASALGISAGCGSLVTSVHTTTHQKSATPSKAPLPAASHPSAGVPQTALQTPLQTDWQNTVATSPLLSGATVSAYAYDLTTHQPLAAIHPNHLQIPASVTKLFTSVAGLAALGPDFSYETKAEAAPAVLSGKPGPIYLVGGGDPWLEANGTQGLQSLAAAVAKKIPRATQVIGVGSLFTPPGAAPGWSASELQDDFAAGASALMAERSEIEVIVTSSAIGTPVRIGLQFNSKITDPGYFQIRNEATTVASGATGVTISRLLGTNTIVVQGSLRAGGEAVNVLSVHDPAAFAAALFQVALSQDGVHFTSASTTGALPAQAGVVAMQRSRPLSYLLTMQNRYSINQMADSLYRMLGVVQSGVGSPQAAQAAMTSFERKAGLSAGGLQVDGSGLSPLDQRSAAQVVGILAYAAAQPWFSVFEQSLMEAGNANPKVCGVICGHFVNTPAANRVWLKTGNLENQWNYAGYANAANGDRIAFAILVEGPLTKSLDGFGGALSPIDQMTVDLATWPKEPQTSAPLPVPAPAAPPAVAAIEQALSSAPGATTGGAVIDLRTGNVVWQENGGTLLRTAWVPRLALLDAALAHGPAAFGPVTLGAGGPVQGGVLSGPLIIDGNGNPGITPENLAQLAQEVRNQGIQRITGPVEYVQGPAASQGVARWPSGAVYEALGQAWLPPLSRLTVGGDLVTLTVSATAPGKPTQVAVSPADAPITVVNEAVGGAAGSVAGPSVQLLRGTTEYLVTGTVPVSAPAVLTVAPPSPGMLAATMLRDDLLAAGVQVPVAGIHSVLTAGGDATLASLPGSSVASLAAPMLSEASSGVAAQVAQLLGANGAKEVQAVAGAADILPDPTGGAMNDYMTPLSVAKMLALAWQQPGEQPLVSALGTTGLWTATSPDAEVQVGYFVGPDGTPYAVAFLQSGLPWSGTWAPRITPGGQAP